MQILQVVIITLIVVYSMLGVINCSDGLDKYVFDMATVDGLNRKETGQCYGTSGQPRKIADNVENFGRKTVESPLCYKNLEYQELKTLFDKESYKSAIANLSETYCPLWKERRHCLLIHVRRGCTKNERKIAEESLHLNVPVILSESLCQHQGNNSLLFLLTEASESGLWDCVTNNTNFAMAYDYCRNRTIAKDNVTPDFLNYIRDMFKCLSPVLAYCANGDSARESAILRTLNTIYTALQAVQKETWKRSPSEWLYANNMNLFGRTSF